MRLTLVFKPHSMYLATGEYFVRAARRLKIPYTTKYKKNAEAVLNIESGDKDLFHQGTVTAVYQIDVRQQNGIPDDRMIYYSDVYFATHKPDRGLKKFKLLPHGFDPILCGIKPKKEYDVALSGRSYNRRNEIFGLVDSKFNCIRVPNKTPTREYLKLIAKAKIILNVTNWKEMNRRVFDGMALGVTLVDDCKDVKMLGKKGKHFLTFKSEKDIIDVIENILNDEEKYNKIRQEGRKYAYENHTYDIRLKKAYNILKEIYDERVH